MSGKSLVSVIIIFLNEERFIREAIESVFVQTYDNWELLLVDDGSDDESTKIAEHYAIRNPDRVYYLEHPEHENRGMSLSRNLGISHARGDYIAFLDADDVWLPHKLEEQVAIMLSQSEAAMVYGESLYWFSWTEKPQDIARDYVQPHGIRSDFLYRPPSLLPLYLRGKAAIPCPSSIIVRRELIETIGGFEGRFHSLYEDQVFFAKLCLRAPIYPSDNCWDKYRQHADQSCAVVEESNDSILSRMFYLEWLKVYMSEQGITDESVLQGLHREMWLYRHYYSTDIALPSKMKYYVRWVKKWLLWLDEAIIPSPISRYLWRHCFNPQ
jgi:glycosyltransferase involved in cell wall biosynthesis